MKVIKSRFLMVFLTNKDKILCHFLLCMLTDNPGNQSSTLKDMLPPSNLYVDKDLCSLWYMFLYQGKFEAHPGYALA